MVRLSRRLLLSTLGVFVAFGLGVTVGAPWVAQNALGHAAQTRKWELRSRGGHIGLRGIWFDEVKIDAGTDVAIHGVFHAACVRWSSVLGRPSLSLGNGQLDLIGSPEELRRLLRGNAEASGNAARSNSTELDLYHLDAKWRSRIDAEPAIVATAIEVHRNDGRWRIQLDALRASHGGISFELKDAHAAPIGSESTTEGLPYQIRAAEFLAQYDTSTARPTLRGNPSPKSAAAAPSAATLPSAALALPLATKPTKTAAIKGVGFLQPGSDATHNGKREVLPLLTELLDELERLRNEVDAGRTSANESSSAWVERIPMGTRFETSRMRLRLVDLGQSIELGPWPLKAEHQDEKLEVELSQTAEAGSTALSAKLNLADRFEQATLRFAVGPVALPQLGVKDGDFGLENTAATRLGIEANAEFLSKSGELVVQSKGRLERMSIRQPFLARETVKNLGFEWQGSATFDGAARRIKSDLMRISVGAVSARLSGTLELGRSHQVIDAKLEVPLGACQDLFDVLPEGLAPLLRGWRVDRNFAMKLSVSFDSRRVEKSKIGLALDNDCRVVSVPPEVAPTRFERPFVLEVEDEQGNFQPTSFGPGTLNWTPLSAISPYVESAVLVCEDGRFLNHDGFDREAIQNSIRENLRTGRFVRGASTVSMQLAKNLYLRRDKTIARKLQEAALTMLLEQTFSKREMLEVYLNVIEFGPGIYGIGPAAKHYFETTPDRLTLAQAFFLMSILPSPKQHHFGADGLVHAGRVKLLHSLMRIAQKRGHFSETELESGLAEQLAFRVSGNPTSAPGHRVLIDPGAPMDDALNLPMPELE